MSNEQKVAIITGASQGIGAGLVKAYRDRNYRVVADVALDQADRSTRTSSRSPATSPIRRPRSASSSRRSTRFGRDRHAGQQCRHLHRQAVHRLHAKRISTPVATNLAGFFHITQRAAAEMLKQGSGHIVSITTSLTDQRRRQRADGARRPDQGRHQLRDQGAGDRVCDAGASA